MKVKKAVSGRGPISSDLLLVLANFISHEIMNMTAQNYDVPHNSQEWLPGIVIYSKLGSFSPF